MGQGLHPALRMAPSSPRRRPLGADPHDRQVLQPVTVSQGNSVWTTDLLTLMGSLPAFVHGGGGLPVISYISSFLLSPNFLMNLILFFKLS